ncbi:hemerythrin domain-containing protein [Candidatus Kaiserbacteria bacterium]|nr:hemerythrin domain-containing protein [Candidatus Kaiserbacteria bacterium]
MVNNTQELIETLKSQHRKIQSDLRAAYDELKSEGETPSSAIVADLSRFKKDLEEHLKLESEEFYPDYLAKKEARGEDTDSAKKFIRMMDDIGEVVMAFLYKYSTEEAVENSRDTFEDELLEIIDTLNTRIETEEQGVYDIYLLS